MERMVMPIIINKFFFQNKKCIVEIRERKRLKNIFKVTKLFLKRVRIILKRSKLYKNKINAYRQLQECNKKGNNKKIQQVRNTKGNHIQNSQPQKSNKKRHP